MCNLFVERTLPRISLSLIVVILGPLPLKADAPKPARVVLASKGYVMPASQVTISPKVAGQIVELRFEEGKQVKAGEVLARLDSDEFKGALLVAHARLRLAEAEL